MNAPARTRRPRAFPPRAAALAASTLALFLGTAPAVASDALDRRLIDALLAEDLTSARLALESGADANAVLGDHMRDQALCAAIDTRGTAALELLLEFGARVDTVSRTGRRQLRSPLACAIEYYNPDAFDLLLELGADPDPDLCPECSPRFGHTVLTEALMSSRFPMALALVELGPLDDVERDKLVYVLENTPYDAYHPWADEREALIRWTRDQGIELDPLPANEGPPGTVPKCVFSVRDIEEGRAEGSICP